MQSNSSYLIYLLIPILLGLGFTVFGSIFLVMSFRAKKESQAAQKWAATTGRITATSLRSHTVYSTEGAPSNNYEPIVEYEYSVLGTPYQGRRVAFGADSFGYRQAQRVLQSYPQGNVVTVYYDPNNPAEAVLEQAAKGTGIFTAIGVIFIIVGLGACCVGAGIAVLVSGVK